MKRGVERLSEAFERVYTLFFEKCQQLLMRDANAVYLLCLPEASMINGHTLVVDGGFCISG